MADFNLLSKYKDTAKRIRDALNFCKNNNERELILPTDIYYIKKDYAYEKFLSVSNHSNGLKRIAFLLEDFSDFTLDLSGSTLVMEDVITPFALINCKNVHIKNFKVKNLKPISSYGVLTDVRENGFSFKVTGSPIYAENGVLMGGEKDSEHGPIRRMNEWRKEDGWLTGKYQNVEFPGLEFRQKEGTEDEFDAFGGSGYINKLESGNFVSLQHVWRTACGVFIESSVGTKITDYTIYSGMGMGVIAQNCDGVEIERMTVRPELGSCFTLSADTTHFVHCRGLISVKNSYFESMLDDALNVHGIYLRIAEKTENGVILKFMHPSALGIDCVRPGQVLESCDPESLIPKKRYTVKSVQRLNLELIEVTFEEDFDDITVGDDMNEVSYECEVVFENNIIRNNRARGVLLASAGKTVVRNNIFETPGAAVKFESNGDFWFESGGTRDVLITENKFINALYVEGGWGSGSVIDVAPRRKIEEGKYYHGKIEISDNYFTNIKKPVAKINNVERLIVKNNTFDNCKSTEIITEYVKNKEITEE